MRTNLLFASAAITLLSVVALPAHAQRLGGGIHAGAAGAIGGRFGGAQVSGFERAHAAASTSGVTARESATARASAGSMKNGVDAGARAGSHVAADGRGAASSAAVEGRTALGAGATEGRAAANGTVNGAQTLAGTSAGDGRIAVRAAESAGASAMSTRETGNQPSSTRTPSAIRTPPANNKLALTGKASQQSTSQLTGPSTRARVSESAVGGASTTPGNASVGATENTSAGTSVNTSH
jgi:hypothetical protein